MQESKYAESKERDDSWMDVLPGAGEDSSVVVKAALWFGKKNSGSLNFFKRFAKENIGVFQDELSDSRTEYSIELYDCHQNYLQLFEKELEDFVASEGADLSQFESECRDLMDGKSLTLFSNEDYSWFLDAVFASLEFEQFYIQMKNFTMKCSNRKSKK